MIETWCWRCGIEYPMLEDSEWSVIQTAHAFMHEDRAAPMRQLAADARRLGLSQPRAIDRNAPLVAQRLWHMIAGFEMFTGILETSPNPIYHHVLSAYGPPCSCCGKLLRTRNATYCVACGTRA
ncbi:hypothetical protein CA13_09810 [Planctomycetes bacterium CA13]|uniref:Uncharacterized protein n=1 Tax=Novipirellula herctigrandis TaxID=2527986 RepID=A0A5C5YYD4_9BACT|nr:hypothetical protein CA13_09810 [Planctomycetes bacterium CA13]